MIQSVRRILRFTFQELKAQSRLQLFLVFNLAFGIVGFLLLQIFQQSVLNQTRAKAQETMGGDFSISARRLFSPEDIANLETNFQFIEKSETKTFFAMLSNQSKSRLVQVVAFDEKFPLYGEYEFVQKQNFSNQKKIWLDQNLTLPLNVQSTTRLKLGQTEFELGDTVTKDPTRTFRPGGFAPIVYIPLQYLPETQLIQVGSTVNHQFLYKLSSPAVAAQAVDVLSKKILDTTIRFETATQDAEGGNSVLKYFTDYLGLVSLVALGLCFLCGGYLLRWIFIEQKKNIAIYKTLGLQNSEMIQIQILKNTAMSVVSFLISSTVVFLVLPFVQQTLSRYQLPITLEFSAYSFWITFSISLIVPQMIALPLMIEMIQLSPKELFQAQIASTAQNKYFWLWLIFCITSFWGLTVYQSQSIKTGSVFTFGLIVLYFIFKILLLVVFKLLNYILPSMHWVNRYSLLGMIRRQQATDLVFITMSLSILVLCLLPHVKSSIINEIKPESASQIPKLFLFDIQPEQKETLQKIASVELSQELSFTPLVRSRILKLNDQNYERAESEVAFTTREDEEEARFRNRGVNLTYKSKLQNSEKIVEGTWAEKNYDSEKDPNSIPEISLEKKYAERVGAKLNDVMTFDVQGLEIKGRITSIRQVRWTSFEPNFFIVFQPGVLEDAPQVFLSSIANIQTAQIEKYQSVVVEKLPNVSIINLQQTVESGLVFIDQMSIALQAMAYMSMVVGVFVFIVLLNTQVKDRLIEMNLLQILGTANKTVVQIVRRQFLFLISLSLVSGVGFSFVAAAVVMKIIFGVGISFDYVAVFRLVLILIPVTVIGIYWGLRPLKTLSPNDLIRGG